MESPPGRQTALTMRVSEYCGKTRPAVATNTGERIFIHVPPLEAVGADDQQLRSTVDSCDTRNKRGRGRAKQVDY